jgi:hypothetical protein
VRHAAGVKISFGPVRVFGVSYGDDAGEVVCDLDAGAVLLGAVLLRQIARDRLYLGIPRLLSRLGQCF